MCPWPSTFPIFVIYLHLVLVHDCGTSLSSCWLKWSWRQVAPFAPVEWVCNKTASRPDLCAFVEPVLQIVCTHNQGHCGPHVPRWPASVLRAHNFVYLCHALFVSLHSPECISTAKTDGGLLKEVSFQLLCKEDWYCAVLWTKSARDSAVVQVLFYFFKLLLSQGWGEMLYKCLSLRVREQWKVARAEWACAAARDVSGNFFFMGPPFPPPPQTYLCSCSCVSFTCLYMFVVLCNLNLLYKVHKQ